MRQKGKPLSSQPSQSTLGIPNLSTKQTCENCVTDDIIGIKFGIGLILETLNNVCFDIGTYAFQWKLIYDNWIFKEPPLYDFGVYKLTELQINYQTLFQFETVIKLIKVRSAINLKMFKFVVLVIVAIIACVAGKPKPGILAAYSAPLIASSPYVASPYAAAYSAYPSYSAPLIASPAAYSAYSAYSAYPYAAAPLYY